MNDFAVSGRIKSFFVAQIIDIPSRKYIVERVGDLPNDEPSNSSNARLAGPKPHNDGVKDLQRGEVAGAV